jgi:hypothetical protein
MSASGHKQTVDLGAIFPRVPMDDDEVHLHVTYASHLDMDEAFCACMRSGIGECADWCHHHARHQEA